MAQDDLAAELLVLEKRFWQAMQDGDGAAAAQLTADHCLLAGPQGASRLDRATVAGIISQRKGWSLKRFEITELNALPAGEGAAVAIYKVHEEMEVEGQAITLDAVDSSTWVRQGDGWVCVMHTESLLGDPYGRDRAKG